jgi:hypothetical protein
MEGLAHPLPVVIIDIPIQQTPTPTIPNVFVKCVGFPGVSGVECQAAEILAKMK